MNQIKLGDICKLKNGYAFKSDDFIIDGIPIVRIGEIEDGNVNLENSIKVKEKETFKDFLIKKDSILIAMSGATTGKIGKYKHEIKAYQNQRVGCFIPDKNKLNNDYLYFYLKTMRSKILQKAYGGGQPNISPKEIELLNIPLPENYADQIQIANLLTRAENLITKRKESIKALDDLLKSTFLEMFGDPINIKASWTKTTIGEVCKIKGGGTPSKAKPEYFAGNIPWVTPKDMKALYINNSIDKITEDAIKNSSTNLIPKGSVLMVVRSGILKNKLPIAINTVDVTINQDMKAFVSKLIESACLLYYFISNEKMMLKKVRATTAENFNFEDIRNMVISIPPKPLQNQFVNLVVRAEFLKKNQIKSLNELENLYDTISQRAFKGNLRITDVR